MAGKREEPHRKTTRALEYLGIGDHLIGSERGRELLEGWRRRSSGYERVKGVRLGVQLAPKIGGA
jgi:hypothetical protein